VRDGGHPLRAISFLVLTLAVGLPAVAADAPSITVGSVAPTFESLQVLNPKTSGVTRFAFDGKPSGESKAVLLSFFATWCPGCVNEAPVLAELQRTYGSKGLKVVSLTIEKDPSAHDRMRTLLDKVGATYTAAFDDNERVRRAFQGRKFSLPFLYLINGEGKIVAMHEGFDEGTGARMRTEVEKVLK
jgi:thiol-disulfide isomerase/thioredoxin